MAEWNNGMQPGGVFTASAGQDVCVGQYVSPPLAAQTITGTFKMYMEFREANAANDSRAQVVIRVVSNDGSTVRGTLYAGDTATSGANPASEFVTTSTNRSFPRAGLSPATITNIGAITAGDRLVIEFGWRTHAGHTSADYRWSWGDPTAGVDLPEDEVTTDVSRVPWIEFSNGITLSQLGNFEFVNEPSSPTGLSSSGNDPNSWPADRDGSFVSTSTDNRRDLYNLTPVSGAYTIDGPIAIKSFARKVDPGTRKIAHVYKTSGAEQATADIALSTNWGPRESLLDTDGTDSAVFSDSKVNSLQVGPKARP